ncbi:hypothetical protein SDC9_122034 [bioreactor metagenome]|uniref:Uncharacterized protein n=1 Tax=bioreactor metagenome TaxID=1076179 RepID=A0A645CDQ6_9ZZZZ
MQTNNISGIINTEYNFSVIVVRVSADSLQKFLVYLLLKLKVEFFFDVHPVPPLIFHKDILT